ncbi:MAG: ABC transporter ATP-binding protein [Myxococcota bacterium]|nr:ABC transporter ATP-binding protein [Myxococcota bacterium]
MSTKSTLSKTEQAVLDAANDPILKKMLEQERIESEEVDISLLFRLLSYLKSHRGLASLCFGLSLIEALLMTMPAYAIGLAVDIVRSGPGSRGTGRGLDGILDGASTAIGGLFFSGQALDARALIICYGILILSLWTARWVIATTTTYCVRMLGQRIVHDLRMDVYNHIIAMDMGYFHKNPVGRLVNRTAFDTNTLSEFFSDALAQGTRDILFVLVLIVVMLTLDVPLALVLLGTFPLLILSGDVYRRVARPAMRTTSAVVSRMNSWLAENIAGMRENQLYKVEPKRRGEFGALTDAHQHSVKRWIQAWGLLRPVMMGFCAIATAAVLWLGYERVLAGVVTVGVLLTFLRYTTRLWVPIRNLAEKFSLIQTALTATERIFDVLDTPTQMKTSDEADLELTVARGDIAFEDVRFGYPAKPDEEVLQGISWSAAKGEMIALVGDTGAGKSTIAHLLSRFYDVTEGTVRIDGRDVREYDLGKLREGIAIVPQDVVIFAGTVRDNITLGLEVSDEVVWEAARAVCADRFIDRFEDGLEHIMDEGGRTLSAGERQLLSFARALVFNPPVLILDEATANVDTETENMIQEALARLTEGRTSVVIAHRLSTIREADQILVLRHGQIIERGKHEELLEKGGEYARLYELHMSD